ncbi:hypothetical protein V8F20_009787 [Naviculisporaceae sp. PSN 640]
MRLPSSLLALLGVMILGTTATQESASSSLPASSPSPAADAELELICHTDNPAECYPKIFQATDEFQIVKPDQDLPKGLHVRLNVQTGQKEAKINVPDEENPALAGLPVDSSVVIVEPEEGGAASQPDSQKIPKNAPAYDPVGKIKTPKAVTPEEKTETSSFYKSLAILKKGLDIDGALEMLEDISHDIYYGLKITEDYDTLKHLFCLANTGSIFEPAPHSASSMADTHRVTLSRAKLAALTISSAVQNNPKALSEIEKHWKVLKTEKCPATSEPLGTATFRLVSSSSADSSIDDASNDPSVAKARISAISGLLKNKSLREHFLSAGGMELLLDILVISPENDEWEPAQRKAALLVLDNFLDEDMGAAIGEWPSSKSPQQAKDKDCAARTQISGECWDWHAKQLADRHRKNDRNHWSVELWDKLKEQRKKVGGRKGGKDEL